MGIMDTHLYLSLVSKTFSCILWHHLNLMLLVCIASNKKESP